MALSTLRCRLNGFPSNPHLLSLFKILTYIYIVVMIIFPPPPSFQHNRCVLSLYWAESLGYLRNLLISIFFFFFVKQKNRLENYWYVDFIWGLFEESENMVFFVGFRQKLILLLIVLLLSIHYSWYEPENVV